MTKENEILRIGEKVLAELDHFGRTYKLLPTPISKTQSTISQGQDYLKREPFIAYIKAKINDEEMILLVCRNDVPRDEHYNRKVSSDLSPPAVFISYNLASVSFYGYMQKLPEYEVGYKFAFNHTAKALGQNLPYIRGVILEKHFFRPEKNESWDTVNNQFFLYLGEHSLKSSLRDFIKNQSEIRELEETKRVSEIRVEKAQREKELALAEEEINRIAGVEESLAKERVKGERIKQGLMREVISKIELRDQPILDRTQGEISRLPFASKMIIMGAPGTGKTTTLIKRIAKGTNSDYLDDADKRGVENPDKFFHPNNWCMFTPTEILKIYLKEAFSKEGVTTTDKHVKVWEDESLRLGRDVFGYLGKDEIFTPTDEVLLSVKDNVDLISYAEQFIKYFNNFIFEIIKSLSRIIKGRFGTVEIADKFSSISNKLEQSREKESAFFDAVTALHELKPLGNKKRQEVEGEIEKISADILKQNELREHIYNICRQYKSETDEDIGVKAKEQVKSAIKRFSRSKSIGSEIRGKGVVPTIITYLQSKDVFSSFDPISLGKQLIRSGNIETLFSVGGYELLLENVASVYSNFRTDYDEEPSFLNESQKDMIEEKKLSRQEIDLLNFVILRNANRIFQRNKHFLEENSGIKILEKLKETYKIQVAVDEATDFSSLQLGCMYYLAHPKFQSFSISGDLMQRVTQFGLTKWEDCSFFANLFKSPVSKVYRQSPKLLQIARHLYEEMMDEEPEFESAFEEDEVDPEPLKYQAQDDESLGKWIAERVEEIRQYNDNTLPSIAIFVCNDDEIEKTVKFIKEPLQKNAIEIKGCPKGEILGSGGKVRVFSIQFIKGLEFEGVFFIDLDRISDDNPDLVDKYLYVGLTRASSFLAVTYRTVFPEKVHFIEQYFKDGDWQL